jgi:signal transduction histidine kinase
MVMTVVLAIAGAGLIVTLRSSLVDEIDRSLRSRSADIATQIELPNEFLDLDNGVDERTVAAVVGTDGFVLATSDESIDGDVVVDLQAQHRPGLPFDGSLSLAGTAGADNMRVLIVAGEFSVPDEVEADVVFVEDAYVLVASSLDGVDATVRRVLIVAAVAGPVLVVIAAVLTLWLTRRALRPVDDIRREVDEITASALDRRVPVPPSDDEIGRLATTMNAMLARLEHTNAAQRRFVSDASHELRSPLASMAARLDVAARHGRTEEWPDVVAALRDDTWRLQRLVDDLLLLARRDAGDELGLRRLDLVDLDDVALGIVADIAPHSGDVAIDTGGLSAGLTVGDADQLGRVVRNLLDNAVRHASQSVAVRLGEVDGDVVLTVDDDGGGIPVADRDRIFERFVRLDEGRSRDRGGSGLGLAICAEIADAHGGSVTVGDAPGGGARFELRLPAARS